jgi:hypothetical protein
MIPQQASIQAQAKGESKRDHRPPHYIQSGDSRECRTAYAADYNATMAAQKKRTTNATAALTVRAK